MLRFDIQGLQEALEGNLRALAAVSPRGGLGRAVKYVVIGAHRYEVAVAHADTGAMRGAFRMQADDARGSIYTDPSAVNPRSRRKVLEYAAIEHKRGYPHNYAQRTVVERGGQLAREAAQGVIREI